METNVERNNGNGGNGSGCSLMGGAVLAVAFVGGLLSVPPLTMLIIVVVLVFIVTCFRRY